MSRKVASKKQKVVRKSPSPDPSSDHDEESKSRSPSPASDASEKGSDHEEKSDASDEEERKESNKKKKSPSPPPKKKKGEKRKKDKDSGSEKESDKSSNSDSASSASDKDSDSDSDAEEKNKKKKKDDSDSGSDSDKEKKKKKTKKDTKKKDKHVSKKHKSDLPKVDEPATSDDEEDDKPIISSKGKGNKKKKKTKSKGSDSDADDDESDSDVEMKDSHKSKHSHGNVKPSELMQDWMKFASPEAKEEMKAFIAAQQKPDKKLLAAARQEAVVVYKKVVAELEEKHGFKGTPRDQLTMIIDSVNELSSQVKHGCVVATHPDQALWMKCRADLTTQHILDFYNKDVMKLIKITRTEKKESDENSSRFVKKKKKGMNVWFINVKHPFEQHWNGQSPWGFTFWTCFGRIVYGDYGPCEAMGINGNVGQVYQNGGVQGALGASIGFAISADSYNPMTKCPRTFKNPTMMAAVKTIDRINKHIAKSIIEVKGSLTAWRAHHSHKIKKLKGSKLYHFLIGPDSKCFSGKTGHDEAYSESIRGSSPCFRKLGRNEVLSPSEMKPPSKMYATHLQNDEGQTILHRRLPVSIARRPEDIVPGEHYESNCFDHPWEDVMIRGGMYIGAMRIRLGVYEWTANKADTTHTIERILILGEAADLLKVTPINATKCDPRYGIPWAGKFRGIKELREVEAREAAERAEQENRKLLMPAVSEEQQMEDEEAAARAVEEQLTKGKLT